MTKPQIELAVQKALDKTKAANTTPATDAAAQLGANIAIATIVLELAREGYEFKKLIGWRPL